MFRHFKIFKMVVSVVVILQFGFLMPLAPVLAQEAKEVNTPEQIVDLLQPEKIEEVGSKIAEKVNLTEEPVIVESASPENKVIEAESYNKVENVTNEIQPENNEIEILNLPDKEIKPEDTVKKQINYTSLMRQVKNVRTGLGEDKKADVLGDFDNFISQEKDRLDDLPVDFYKKKNYIRRLKGQLKGVDDTDQTFTQQILDKVISIFGFGVDELDFDEEQIFNKEEFKMPNNPAEFGFNKDVPNLQEINDITVPADQKIDNSLKTFITIQEVKADSILPVIEDLQSDEQEIIINSTIRDLASDLNNNPVEIYNFVRENINYEAYYGAKKGNLGCLEERICNDVDTASLTISLMRAAGIPANYKKSIMVVSIDKLQDLLGIEKTVEGRRTVYGIFGWNDIPVYTISNNPTVGGNLDDGDFTNETHFALEWIFPEIYYDYDERGGNIDNWNDLNIVSTTEELQSSLAEEYKKQWLPLDVIFKNYNYSPKEIVSDTANFNTENFWYNFYQYQGDLSPLEKYTQDLLSSTGKNIDNENYQSINYEVNKNYEILPPTLPYVLGEGVDGNGQQILPEVWSTLPDIRKAQVKIQLKKTDTEEVVLEHTFFGSEINNKELNLYYEGATEADQQIIDSYGGVHATPAELVDIKAYFLGDYDRFDGTGVFSIGDSMVLRFEYYKKGIMEHDDEKFSTAGNQEGIYIVLSKVQEDPYLETNSEILLRGNVGLAREYLLRVQNANELLEKSLDYNVNINFARAVVTQNRILNTVNGNPTTFDFKGLTIDASTYINDWSNRGNYKNHRKDFRLLWGLEASYYEAQIFDDVAGLEGISTVAGLQYAYAHPAEYTVHIINSNNEATIDSLELSDNTKNNMHADVQLGNTIITPNKFVSAGTWNGIFYVSLDPVWTGTYAIGEQTGENGGWTVDGVLVASFTDVEMNFLDYYYNYNELLKKYFAYQEGRSVYDIKCTLSQSQYNSIMNDDQWNMSYGFPCTKQVMNFGDHNHTYILGSWGVKFISNSEYYNYWITAGQVAQIMKTDRYVDNHMSLNNINLDGQFKFNPIAGTYSWAGHYGYWNSLITDYYQPMYNERGTGRLVYGDVLSKLMEYRYNAESTYCPTIINDPQGYCGKKNWVLYLMGYPTDNIKWAYDYIVDWGNDTEGYYQDFLGGQVYKRTAGKGSNATYYVPEPIETFFNSNDFAVNNHTGTGGEFGFPKTDPIFKNDGYTVKQSFDGGGIAWNHNTNDVYYEYAADYFCDEININNKFIIGEALLQGIWEGGSTIIKGVVVFGASTFVLGSAIDLVFGTHGGVTIATWGLIGAGATTAIYKISTDIGWGNFLAGVDSKVKYEIEHSNCAARQTYLLAKYVPEFATLVMGMKGLVAKTSEVKGGLTLTNNIFRLSSDQIVPKMKEVFIANAKFFFPGEKNNSASKIVDGKQVEFNNKSIEITKKYDRMPTREELGQIASETFNNENLIKAVVQEKGWLKLKDLVPFDESSQFANSNNVILNKSGFIVENGKIRIKNNWEISGIAKVAVKDGKVSYMKPGIDQYTGLYESHAKLFQGQSVDGAFSLKFNNKGELIKYNWWSGHYQTPEERIELLEFLFKESGVDMSKAVRVGLDDPDLGDPSIF